MPPNYTELHQIQIKLKDSQEKRKADSWGIKRRITTMEEDYSSLACVAIRLLYQPPARSPKETTARQANSSSNLISEQVVTKIDTNFKVTRQIGAFAPLKNSSIFYSWKCCFIHVSCSGEIQLRAQISSSAGAGLWAFSASYLLPLAQEDQNPVSELRSFDGWPCLWWSDTNQNLQGLRVARQSTGWLPRTVLLLFACNQQQVWWSLCWDIQISGGKILRIEYEFS